MARCIVNSPPDNNNHQESEVSTTSSSIFNRFKKQNNFGSREFKKGVSQVSLFGSSAYRPSFGIFSDPLINNFIQNPANINNLPHMSNDHVDVTGVSNDVGAANGYVFPKPAKITQGFKTFGIRLGKFGHLYGTGAFFSHHEYPYEIR